MKVFTKRVLALSAGLALAASTFSTASAMTPRGWVVSSDSFGALGATSGSAGLSSVRLWDSHSNWCDIQPTADADMIANLEARMAPAIDANATAGPRTVIVSLGHPAPWVFGDSPAAKKRTVHWYCQGTAASASIPSPSTLGPGSVQAERFRTYSDTVLSFLAQRYAGQSIRFLVQVYNEPNLIGGINVKLKVPGAATDVKSAAKALHLYERIANQSVSAARAQGDFHLISTSLFQRSNAFSTAYMAEMNRDPIAETLAFNVYSWQRRQPDAMIANWNKKAGNIKALVHKYKRLRSKPVLITEANHNLVNNNHDRSNLKPAIVAAPTQIRLASGTQMDAYFQGFAGVYWFSAGRSQAAVNIRDASGPARQALTLLGAQLTGRRLTGCTSKSGVRRCTFADPSGASKSIVVLWRTRGTSTVRIPRGTVTRMTGQTESASGRLRVGTTPIIFQ